MWKGKPCFSQAGKRYKSIDEIRRNTMKLVIDLPEEMVREVRDAVRRGGYNEPHDFVVTALKNQLEIEEGGGSRYQTLEEAIEDYEDDDDSGGRAEEEEETATDGLGKRDYTAVPTVSPPDTDRLGMRPLWGQFNRILPVKITVRRLVNSILERNGEEGITEHAEMETVNLGIFRDDTAKVAREFGRKVKEYDERKNRKRGEKMSTALPVGEDAEKSMKRFKSHFVGSMDKAGSVNGAPANLLFVNLFQGDINTIGVTDLGLEFAELRNPLLDGGPDSDRPLSDEECEFYIEHVRDEIPEEYEAMELIARAIEEGDDRPDTLTDRVSSIDSEWSQSLAKTMRSGIFSRMYDLGLVSRERVGQRGIQYTLTERGLVFLDDSKEVSEV